MQLKWGIATTGNICKDFVRAVNCLPRENHSVVAVAARNIRNAQDFAAQFGVESSYGSYEKLASDSNIDVVYVGTITSKHFELAKLMLENGKNVLCEKPLTLNKKQSSELVNLAKANNVFLMEAIWSRCFPIYKRLEEAIKSKEIGDIRFIDCSLGFEMGRNLKNADGSSCLLDIGIYNLQIALLAFGHEKPIKISAVGNLNDDGVDLTYGVGLKFANGGIAKLDGSVDINFKNDATIYGTKGNIVVHNSFCAPSKITIGAKEIEMPTPNQDIKTIFPGSIGLQYEAEEVRQCLIKGLKECPLIPLSESLLLAEIMDEIRSQMGVVFESE